MAKKDQQASWEKKRYKSSPKNDVEPVPEIQNKTTNKKKFKFK
ncbi:hypothetical protein [Hathewaya limosa]|uniref:Uncharacterized protein n=1 Tax=Hathewaya limosa TaxID=1536 RepID=A0ABU0JXD9_HATLI|nr:hypothetical protein [Hathewaya limosa]MDQ0480911.1 hypothetical protein [Hathewaya limosa]